MNWVPGNSQLLRENEQKMGHILAKNGFRIKILAYSDSAHRALSNEV